MSDKVTSDNIIQDKIYMERAFELSKLGKGHTDPNPLVGAVVVKDGEIIGEGYHKEYGGPHAEVFALDQAGENAKGATIYVTLEPCSHYGKTPPCALKIINMGIKRCVISILDPNPLVSGRGAQMLRDAGIEVEVGLLEERARVVNRIFLKYIVDKIPYVFLKCAITLDGKIATHNGSSKWITNEVSRMRVQELRSRYEGLMIGVNTLMLDNPRLTSRMPNGRNPYRIVIDPKLRTPMDSNFVKNKDGKSIIITSTFNANDEKIAYLEDAGVRCVFLPGYDFPIKDILKKIGELKIDSVLIEGGSRLISKAFREEVIDAGEIFIAPRILGDTRALSFVQGFQVDEISQGIHLKNVKFNTYGDNVSVEFHR